jgi:hypothetical protein
MEHHDYEAVPPDVWNCLVKWYGFHAEQKPIMRIINFDKRAAKFYVDLYQENNREPAEDTDLSDLL